MDTFAVTLRVSRALFVATLFLLAANPLLADDAAAESPSSPLVRRESTAA
jgi:hypothetical protein